MDQEEAGSSALLRRIDVCCPTHRTCFDGRETVDTRTMLASGPFTVNGVFDVPTPSSVDCIDLVLRANCMRGGLRIPARRHPASLAPIGIVTRNQQRGGRSCLSGGTACARPVACASSARCAVWETRTEARSASKKVAGSASLPVPRVARQPCERARPPWRGGPIGSIGFAVLGKDSREERGMVGATGFEPATSSSRTKRATKLRHAPTGGGV